jgi:hypothetical protein
VRVVVSLALARLRHRPTRWLLVALGVAAASVLPVAAQSTAGVVAAQALRYGVEALPPGDRALAAIRDGQRESPAVLADVATTARAALAGLSAGPVRAQMLTRAISDGAGGTYYFGGADDLTERVRVVQGRAPAGCTPTRCEVVAVGPGRPDPAPAVGLVVVGRAVRTDPLLLAGSFDPGPDATLLLADGVAAAAQLEYLSAFLRSYAWVSPVDLDRVNALGVDGYLARSAQAAVVLHGQRLSLTAPDEQLRSQADRAQLSARRFALLAGAATALLLGFCVIGAIGLRRDHTAAAALLRRRGARQWHLVALAGIAGAVPVAAGTLFGLAAGAVLAAVTARAAGLPAAGSASAAVRAALPAVGLGALAAVVAVGATLLLGASARAARRGIDVVVGAGALTAALALARGAVTTENLGERADPLLAALPVIVVVCGGLLVGRAWPALTTAAARLVPRRQLAPRLALVGAVRAPLRPVATTAFLAAAVGIVTFAGAYAGTLRQGAADQATFAVPLDASVRSGPSLRTPLDVAGPDAYTAAGLAPYPVVRATGTVRLSVVSALTPELVGVDPAALARVPAWSRVVGAGDPATVAAGLAVSTVEHPGVALAAGTTVLAVPAQGNLSDVDITAWARLPDGRDLPASLTPSPPPPGTEPDGPYAGTLTGAFATPLPAGARLFALAVTETAFAGTRRAHHEGEGDTALPALRGSVTLGEITPGGWRDWGSDTATVTAADTLTVAYSLSGDEAVARAGAASTPTRLSVYADPVTAAAATDGTLTVQVNAGAPVTAVVVGVLPRFPATGSRFLVADARALADALDARDPGTGSVRELWLAGDPAPLHAAPFDLLRVDARSAVRERLAGDPLARGATGLLGTSALLAFLVAQLALVLLVVAERRDESAQLYAWESDGVAPRTLRRSLFLRAVAVVAVGVPGGLAIGLLLSRLTTALVRVTAAGATPVPPLALAITPLWTLVALAGGVGLGLLVCAVLAAASLRERLPRRPEEALS